MHLRARDLDPTTGRFLSVDTVQPNAPGTQGYNRYSYAANNPTTWTDPSGHFAIPPALACAIGGLSCVALFVAIVLLLIAWILLNAVLTAGLDGSTSWEGKADWSIPDLVDLPDSFPWISTAQRIRVYDGQAERDVRARKRKQREVKQRGWEREKANQGYGPTDEIWCESSGQCWIGPAGGGGVFEPFPYFQPVPEPSPVPEAE